MDIRVERVSKIIRLPRSSSAANVLYHTCRKTSWQPDSFAQVQYSGMVVKVGKTLGGETRIRTATDWAVEK